MGRPPKYATEEERREAQRLQKRRSAQILRRQRAGLDPEAPPNATHSGELAPTAKLTSAQVAKIRKLRADQGWTLSSLARQFGMSEHAISDICNGRTWKD